MSYNDAETHIWRMRFTRYDEADLREVVAGGGDLAALAHGQLVARGLEEVTEGKRLTGSIAPPSAALGPE